MGSSADRLRIVDGGVCRGHWCRSHRGKRWPGRCANHFAVFGILQLTVLALADIFRGMNTTLPTPAELAESIKTEVAKLIVGGVIPRTVATFSELHDYVDANCLGGTEQLWEELTSATAAAHPDWSEDQIGQYVRDTMCDLQNAAGEFVNEWIKSTQFPQL
jgi:hypothetical protein